MTRAVSLRIAERDDAPWIIDRHATLYAEDDGFDDSFGHLVAEVTGGFFARHDPVRERGWIALDGARRVGCIFCARLDEDEAKLRLFLVEPAWRGTGLGRRLLATCTSFARDAGYARIGLRTHESHRAATALYARNGWACLDSRPVHSFGVDLVEQGWRLTF